MLFDGCSNYGRGGGYSRGEVRSNFNNSREQVQSSRDRVYNSREHVQGSRERVYNSNYRSYAPKERVHDDKSSTLPRSHGRKESKEELKERSGTLPRSNRGPRPRTYSGGEQGSIRGSGRGRGRDFQAPSLRRINKQRENKQGSDYRARRAQSLPKEDSALPRVLSKSLMTMWSPDGKCLSFADMLKGGSNNHLEDCVERGNLRCK